MSTTFEKRRIEFGDQLAHLRQVAGLAAKDFAAQLGWQPSKVSKIENGRQMPSDDDLVTWLSALDCSSDIVETMRDRLRELRIMNAAWRRQLRAGHRTRQEQDAREEHSATTIRAVDIMAVPGLLQTADYARAIFATQASLLDIPVGDIDDAVRARMLRQQILYEPGRTIEILLAESALGMPVCDAAAMRAQIDRLNSAVGLPAVRFGVLPMHVQYPHLLPNGYWIVDDEVFVEQVSGELRIDDAEQVAVYNRLTERLWPLAVVDDQARALLAAHADRWTAGNRP
ncbi:helix-turn-helix domain-containing protein [Actinokineospora sp.]|uniref:helix-turn-helix domain-containing protein n=1 Tax=Actinokineospora sp. TaxID=1872133 RepID=UPI003D6A2ECB